MLKESHGAEKLRQKEELKCDKEAERQKAAKERATACRIRRQYMECIEDEQQELMELAAMNKGLSSIFSLDSDTLQQLDSFRILYALNFGEPWVHGLSEGDYCELSVQERLNALVTLIGLAIDGNSIQAVLEERIEAATAL